MTIEEMRELRNTTEKEILRLLSEFKAITGLRVDRVQLHSITTTDAGEARGRQHLTHVEIEISL